MNQNSMLNSLQINFNKDQTKTVEAEQDDEFEWVEGEFQNAEENKETQVSSLNPAFESKFISAPSNNSNELWEFSGEKTEKLEDWKEKLEGPQNLGKKNIQSH